MKARAAYTLVSGKIVKNFNDLPDEPAVGGFIEVPFPSPIIRVGEYAEYCQKVDLAEEKLDPGYWERLFGLLVTPVRHGVIVTGYAPVS